MGSDSCVSSVFVKVFLGTFAVMALILVTLVTTEELITTNQVQGRRIGSWSKRTRRTNGTTSSATSDQFVETSMKVVHPEMDLNYMSKRRVPKGPNPIHNRRRGNSGRPPGQA